MQRLENKQIHTHTIHKWYMYLHLVEFLVGKYTIVQWWYGIHNISQTKKIREKFWATWPTVSLHPKFKAWVKKRSCLKINWWVDWWFGVFCKNPQFSFKKRSAPNPKHQRPQTNVFDHFLRTKTFAVPWKITHRIHVWYIYLHLA